MIEFSEMAETMRKSQVKDALRRVSGARSCGAPIGIVGVLASTVKGVGEKLEGIGQRRDKV